MSTRICLFLLIFLLVIGNTDVPRVCYPVDRYAPVYQDFGEHGHVGIDWIVEVGTPVRTVRDGLVIESAEDSRFYGRYLLILHDDGYASLYAHLSELRARKGDYVRACDIIALSGGAVGADGSGQSSGYHLHFEIRPPGHSGSNDYNVNPLWYIRMHTNRRYVPL